MTLRFSGQQNYLSPIGQRWNCRCRESVYAVNKVDLNGFEKCWRINVSCFCLKP